MNIQSNHPQTHLLMNRAIDSFMETLEPRTLLSGGHLDQSFGSGGTVMDLSLPGALAVTVQADGKVVQVGQILGNFELSRFNINGSEDTSFGYFGRLVTDLGGLDTPTQIAVRHDGKIVVALVGTLIKSTEIRCRPQVLALQKSIHKKRPRSMFLRQKP